MTSSRSLSSILTPIELRLSKLLSRETLAQSLPRSGCDRSPGLLQPWELDDFHFNPERVAIPGRNRHAVEVPTAETQGCGPQPWALVRNRVAVIASPKNLRKQFRVNAPAPPRSSTNPQYASLNFVAALMLTAVNLGRRLYRSHLLVQLLPVQFSTDQFAL